MKNGIRDIPGTNTMTYICKSKIPKDSLRNVAFSKIVVVERPHKKEKERTHLTVVGTFIDYLWDKATPTSDLTMSKLLFHSVLSTPGTTFHKADLKTFFLNTPMDCPEYMRLKLNLIPDEMMTKYHLHHYKDDGWV